MSEIIIDGVDVSECAYYLIKDGSCMSQDCECTKCVHNSCYYKDLKLLQNKYDTLTNKFFNSETDKTHLQQKNEKLKKEVKQIGSSFIKKGDYARVLEQENASLKAENKQLEEKYNIALRNNASKTELELENKKLREENFIFEEIVKLCRCEQYQQTLQEIKEIAEDAYKNDEQYQSTGIYNDIIEKVNGILEE